MKQLTIREMLQEEPGIMTEDYRLYMIRDGETVFYVGQAGNPYNRFLSHIEGFGGNGPSHVGEFLFANAPRSGAWLFEQYTIEECRPFVEEYRATFFKAPRALGDYFGLDEAEKSLIKHYRPCLNTAMNPNPLPIPEQYVNPFASSLLIPTPGSSPNYPVSSKESED